MRVRLLAGAAVPVLEASGAITRLQDALDIVAASHEFDAENVLLRAEQLPSEFFELRTRFAGEFVQKLMNYRLKVACVFRDDGSCGPRLREYVHEARTGHWFRSFFDEAEAIAWLVSGTPRA